jgi:hypothetical protein
LTRPRDHSGSIVGSCQRTPPWKRLRPVIHASNPASATSSAAVLRTWQHVRIVLPEIAVRIAPGQRRRLGPDHAHVAQLQSSDQGFAMGLGLRKQLAGVEGDYRRRGIDTRHHMEQHGALGTERGDQPASGPSSSTPRSNATPSSPP